MICPKCSADTRVIDSRPHREDARVIVRRRVCQGCGYRFNTQEGTVDIVGRRASKRARAAKYRSRLTPERHGELKVEWRLRKAASAEAAETDRTVSEIMSTWKADAKPARPPAPYRLPPLP